MATMLSRAISLAENLGRLSSTKVCQVDGFFRIHVNRMILARLYDPEIDTDRRKRRKKEG